MGKTVGKKNKRHAAGRYAAAAAVAPSGDEPPADSVAVADNGDEIPPAPSVEAANGGEQMAKTGSEEEKAPEERRDSSPEREGEVAKLKDLNAKLLRESVEKRGQVAALTARLDEFTADASALADGKREVLWVALVEPLLAAAEEAVALRARLAAIQESLEAAETRAARETEASGEAAAQLEAAVAEKHRVLELFGVKEGEAAAASQKVAELEGVVVELEGKSAELRAERGELENQLGEMTASARRLQAQKAEVEGSFKEFKKSIEKYKQHMEDKLEEKLGELEVLRFRKALRQKKRFRKAEMAKVLSLKAEISAAVAMNRKLEVVVQASKIELAAARRDAEKLRLEDVEVGKKHSLVVTEADGLWIEIDKIVKMKEAAAVAFADEKTELERALEGLKRKVDTIQAEKDAAEGMVHEKDAEAAKLRAELEWLRNSMSEPRVLCSVLRVSSSCLQDEKDTVVKALVEEKVEGGKLRLRIGELESCNVEKDREIGVLKAELEDKEGKIDGLNGELEQLHLAVAEAQQREKNGVWAWLCPATTTVFAAVSIVYAARSQ